MMKLKNLRVAGTMSAATFTLMTSSLPNVSAQTATVDSPVTITVDASQTRGAIRPIWRFFGGDEPNYATMKNGKKLLGAMGKIGPYPAYFRTHSLLSTGDGKPALKWGSTNAYTEDNQGRPIYNWDIVDQILEAGLERGVKPYMQLGFMPKALSTHPEPYQHDWKPGMPYDAIYTGWSYPPKDYEKWGELVYQLTRHCVEKYGVKEVETWYWEAWNEPNIPYWHGTAEEYNKLYDYSVDAVRRALPNAIVGGPEVAGGPGGNYLKNFLEHTVRGTNYVTGKTGSPLDFISFHAKGAPRFVDGHVRMGVGSQLRDIDGASKVIASFPELKDKPIVIGESDPDGCAACTGDQLGYRNGKLYASYTAASFARKSDLVASNGANLEGAITWAFTFENVPYFAGFRQLASNGLDMPVLNVFRMFGKMSGQRLAVQSSGEIPTADIIKSGVRGASDVSGFAALDEGKATVMVWNYHDDDVPAPAANIAFALKGLPAIKGTVKMSHYRIDDQHSNSYTEWQKLGSPQKPTKQQYATLEKAGQLMLLNKPQKVRAVDGQIQTQIQLPRQGVSLLVFEWK